MSKESDMVALLQADATLMALLTGGIYTDEELGIQGFRRDPDSPAFAAFDANGSLLPCAVVRQDAEIPLPAVRMPVQKMSGMNQKLEIFFYEARGRDAIVQAKARTHALLEGTRLPGTFPLMWMGDTSIFYDVGPVANSTGLRQEWRCVQLKRPAA